MALHPLKLPTSASLLCRIVGLQKQLLKALSDPGLAPQTVNAAWVQGVWCRLDAEWVRKFCLGGQEARIQAIAGATPTARKGLYDEFRRQNNVPALLRTGGDFRDLNGLPDIDADLAATVTEFFKDCYALLGQAGRTKGYTFPGGRAITKWGYKERFRDANPTMVVCPYCDGDLGTAELDHYYCKSHFPLLACSPWNLVPICKSCNDTTIAKGDRIALSPGPPRSSVDWLHPFGCPASDGVRIQLSGNPRQSVPQLHSFDANEQRRLDNHHWLLDRLDQPNPSRYLSNRWTNAASAHFDVLVGRVNRRASAANTIQSLVQIQLEDHQAERGRTASAIVHAAVCQAILDQRPEYLEEFGNSNLPELSQ
ncbi:hypothetical protein [Luteolibacter sp. Populi]|uniref:hypothetical protein n=1 Tax=Luteolibacter sp. Populi TaxID=3230487 RepID=UPI003466F840